jgi:peptide/nickel transport system substrate-binding protein
VSESRNTHRVTRRAFIRVSLLAGGATLAGGLLAACQQPAPAAPSPAPASGQAAEQKPAPAAKAAAATGPAEWNVVLSEQTGGADPLTEYGTNAAYYVMHLVVEPLFHVELLPDGKSWGVVNDLAEKWSFPDSKTLLVELKKGVNFHNGEELTAEHVKYTFDALTTDPKPTRRAPSLTPLGTAEVVDKYTIKWAMPEPNLSVLSTVQRMLVAPLARKNMSAEDFEKQPVGTGPYRVVEWPRDGTVKLQAWEGYRRGKPRPERLTFRYVADPSTRVLEALSGSAQIAFTIPIESLASIQGNPNLEVTALKGAQSLSYNINLFKTTPPFRDKRVRQAMNYAIDREAIVRSILGGRGTTLPGPLWPGFLGYTPDVKPYPYDPDMAKKLLADAGHASGFPFTWTVTQGVYPKDIEVAQAAASQLEKVGIKATLQPLERARLLSERNEGGYDVTELVWPMAWMPSSIYTFTLGLTLPDKVLAPRWGGVPPEVTQARKLRDDAGKATSLEQMAEGFAQLNRYMHDEAFWIYIHTVDQIWAVQKDIGWRPYPVDYPLPFDYWASIGKQAPREPDVPLVLG